LFFLFLIWVSISAALLFSSLFDVLSFSKSNHVRLSSVSQPFAMRGDLSSPRSVQFMCSGAGVELATPFQFSTRLWGEDGAFDVPPRPSLFFFFCSQDPLLLLFFPSSIREGGDGTLSFFSPTRRRPFLDEQPFYLSPLFPVRSPSIWERTCFLLPQDLRFICSPTLNSLTVPPRPFEPLS